MDQGKVQAIRDWPQPHSVKDSNDSWIRQLLSQIHSELQSPLRSPHFTSMICQKPKSLSWTPKLGRPPEAPGGLLHCSHPHSSGSPAPVCCGSGRLHHRRGSSAIPTPRRASSSPSLRFLLQEAFPGGAQLRHREQGIAHYQAGVGGVATLAGGSTTPLFRNHRS